MQLLASLENHEGVVVGLILEVLCGLFYTYLGTNAITNYRVSVSLGFGDVCVDASEWMCMWMCADVDVCGYV